jgi:phosphoserine aminotransferase
MKKIYFTVGPSQLYPTVPTYTRHALKDDIFSLSHRSEQAVQLISETTERLRVLLTIPKTHQIFFTASSLENMERSLQNTVERYSFHPIIGEFSKKFFDAAGMLGKKPYKIDLDITNGWKLHELNIPKRTETICITQNETSTGIGIPMQEISQLKKQHPDKILAVDVVSSLPCVPVDFHACDIAFFSVQKGFGLPAGLAVMVVSPQAMEKSVYLAKKGVVIGSYHSFPTLAKAAEKYQTPETPNMFGLYLLGKVAADMHRYGRERILSETEHKAQLLYEACHKHGFAPLSHNTQHRSITTIVVDTKSDAAAIRKRLAAQGMIVSAGYAHRKNSDIRIANFPSHSISSVKKLIRALS